MWYVTPAPQMLDFGWVWFNTGSPLWLNSGGFADFLNNGKPPNVHGFYWPTLLERLHISCSAANKIGLLHQGVQTTKCENKLSWWLQTCWWISWLKQIIIISSHALIVMVFFFFLSHLSSLIWACTWPLKRQWLTIFLAWTVVLLRTTLWVLDGCS